jgi:hypothetical protein
MDLEVLEDEMGAKQTTSCKSGLLDAIFKTYVIKYAANVQ